MEAKYLNFPVSQIPYIITNQKTAMAIIISYAIVSLAEKHDLTIEVAGKYLGINVGRDVEQLAERCHKSSKSFTSIKVNVAFEYLNRDKSQFEITCLCANLAIRSIVGKRSYLLCRKNLIFSRMSGEDSRINAPSYKEYVKDLDGPNGRRRWENVRDVLRAQYGVSFYAPPGCRGFYVSYTLSDEDLAINVERMLIRKRERRKTNRELHILALSAIGCSS